MNTAIILASGNGKRMNSTVPKQYMLLNGETVLFYTVEQFQKSKYIDEIIIVTRAEDIEFCQNEYKQSKISHIVAGGAERYDSVMKGLMAMDEEGYVFIHDGARPCVSQESIEKLYMDVKKYKNAILAVPTKDTVRITDDNQNCILTPERKNVWLIQTPQVFDKRIIKEAYNSFVQIGTEKTITDDAMIFEEFTEYSLHITEGEYKNIKLTTMEDLEILKKYM